MSSETTSGTQAQTRPSGNPEPTPARVPGRRFLLTHPTAWIVLAISLAAGAAGWLIVRNHAELGARKRFDEEAHRIAAALGERMLLYQDVLHGAVGLYAASYSVEREEWRAYIESVSIDKRFPGIDGLGFMACVRRAELDQFLKITRADKTPDFQVRSTGAGANLLVTKYIEPQARHQALLGRDMGPDPQWRAVAEEARDKGDAAMSGALTLAGKGGGPQPGFLMMLPVYHNRQPRGTLAERRASIEGWVYARFVTAQLMRGILANKSPTIHFKILDDTPGAREKLLFENEPQPPNYQPKFSDAILLTPGGRHWRLVFATKPAFESTIPQGSASFTAAGGILFSLLLFGIVWSLSMTRERALAMASDMTAALRSANERLEHERYLLQTLMDNLPHRIYFKDRQSRFLRNNRAHLQCFGLQDPAQAIGKTDFDFFTEEHARQACKDEQEVIRTGRPITKEEKETWPDGSVTWVLTTKMPLRDSTGQIVGTFGISRDITDRKQAEEALRSAKDVAEDASRTKSQFLASMSHELRTPLNSIIGFANILLKNKGGTLSPVELNFLDRIQANGNHLLGLINEILDLSKIEAHKLELQMTPVALDQLVRETVAQEEGLVRDKPVQLLADLPDQVAPILTDADKLKQIIINLIGNALKFTERGNVTVRVLTDPANHHPIRLDVSDTGIGIPADKLGVIFEAFQQAEAGTARKYGGTGLGLTISQALCRLLGYRIEAASEVGRGSTFSIILRGASPAAGAQPPAAPPPKAAPAPLAAPPPAPAPKPSELAGKIVLVIDDEADSRTLLTQMIEEAGCHVISSDSGELGLLMARKLRPHLIITDLLMPVMDGIAFLNALRADPRHQHLPVVVITGKDLTPGESEVLRQETLAVLKKAGAFEDDLKQLLHKLLATPPATPQSPVAPPPQTQ
jgi:PAS domain S-box-containing protein